MSLKITFAAFVSTVFLIQFAFSQEPTKAPPTAALHFGRELNAEDINIGDDLYFTCLAKGIEKVQKFIWYFNDKEIPQNQLIVGLIQSHTETRGELVLQNVVKVSSGEYKCKIEYENGSQESNTFTLTVKDPLRRSTLSSKITAKLGAPLRPDSITESNDIYFDCDTTQIPKFQKITWYHDGREIKANPATGVILSGKSLVLQSITKTSSGDYVCEVDTTEEILRSAPVTLHVKQVATL